MIIWILDCSKGCVTRVKLSEARERELDRYLNELEGDMSDWLSLHEDELGVSLSHSSWMAAENDTVYEVEF